MCGRVLFLIPVLRGGVAWRGTLFVGAMGGVRGGDEGAALDRGDGGAALDGERFA